jgi:formylmethanofuran dehydrogenase subunit E
MYLPHPSSEGILIGHLYQNSPKEFRFNTRFFIKLNKYFHLTLCKNQIKLLIIYFPIMLMMDNKPGTCNGGIHMTDRDILIQKAKEFHGDLCAGIILGTRMTMAGMRELGMNPLERNRNLIVYVEIDRCIADAIQAITGCSLGHRTLKYKPYGKFAATFIDISSGNAVRVAILEKKRTEKTGKEAMKEAVSILLDIPEPELMRITRVKVAIPDGDMPGMPKHRARCSACNEMIVDNKEVTISGTVLCGNCAGESYYTEHG